MIMTFEKNEKKLNKKHIVTSNKQGSIELAGKLLVVIRINIVTQKVMQF